MCTLAERVVACDAAQRGVGAARQLTVHALDGDATRAAAELADGNRPARGTCPGDRCPGAGAQVSGQHLVEPRRDRRHLTHHARRSRLGTVEVGQHRSAGVDEFDVPRAGDKHEIGRRVLRHVRLDRGVVGRFSRYLAGPEVASVEEDALVPRPWRRPHPAAGSETRDKENPWPPPCHRSLPSCLEPISIGYDHDVRSQSVTSLQVASGS
jgi:hypothetical protein